MIQTKTLTYSSSTGKKLKMNIYKDSAEEQRAPLPAVISIHNGHALNGKNGDSIYQYSCQYFAENGFICIDIDCRQRLQDAEFLPDTILQTIHMGVEDLVEATNYILQHAEELNADIQKISLLGNGDGACMALATEYELCRRKRKDSTLDGSLANGLPADFNYACIVAHSGALATNGQQFEWDKQPCPIVLVQGKPKNDIPSNRFYVPGLLWVGGHSLHLELTKVGCQNIYYDVSGFEHLAMIGKKMDSGRITEYLDQFMLRDINLFLSFRPKV